jgi:hypothetical protein
MVQVHGAHEPARLAGKRHAASPCQGTTIAVLRPRATACSSEGSNVEGRTTIEKKRGRRNGPDRHAVGDAAQSAAGSGSDTQKSSDWLAERIESPDESQQGVAVDTGTGLNRGKAKESKRGQR